ncbi:MAG: AraC family transcriptional regulator, partial [Achromobacter sp.]|nr:AraC family transcriptional regulator [Achromobacter sp.]
MPRYSPEAVLDPDSAVCPVVGLAIDTRAHASDWHTHRRTQLLYQAEGGVTLFLPDRVGQLAPLQAAWLPAGCAHRTAMHGKFAYRSLYFDVEAYPDLPAEPVILDVNPLLRELILRLVEQERQPDAEYYRALSDLCVLELRRARSSLPRIPLPEDDDRRLLALCRAVMANPSAEISVEQHAADVGASVRTLARLFQSSLGMGFAAWRRQVQLATAVAALAAGTPVNRIAHELGYTPGAFSEMFRRELG